jgi:pyrroline-5-carboxylate reductase
MAAQLVVMGGGRMGEALVMGLALARPPSDGRAQPAHESFRDIVIVEKLADRRRALAERFEPFGSVRVSDRSEAGAGAVIAVKPTDVAAACAELAALRLPRVLSIAAGVTLSKLEAWLPESCVVRAMPNTPALVGAGAAAISPGARAGDDDLAWAEDILGAVGIVVRVPEASLDAVTGLSGSGPAYIFMVAEAMIEAGVLAGLPRDICARLVTQTIVGSGQLLASSGDGPEALRAAVTSPAGTTAAGLQVLEERALRAALLAAVSAAAERSRQLGKA